MIQFKEYYRAAPVAQRFSATFSPGPDHGHPDRVLVSCLVNFPHSHWCDVVLIFLKEFIYLFMRDAEREAET